MALKTAGLINNHHVKRPTVPVIIHQPAYIFPVDDINIRRCIKRPNAFCLTSKDRRHSEDLRMVPFILLFCPGSFGHFLRGDNENLPNNEPVIFQFPDSGQRRDRFSKALTHVKKQAYFLNFQNFINAMRLIGMWLEHHRASPPSSFRRSKTSWIWRRSSGSMHSISKR